MSRPTHQYVATIKFGAPGKPTGVEKMPFTSRSVRTGTLTAEARDRAEKAWGTDDFLVVSVVPAQPERTPRMSQQYACPYTPCTFTGTEDEVDDHRATGVHNDQPQAGSNLSERPR